MYRYVEEIPEDVAVALHQIGSDATEVARLARVYGRVPGGLAPHLQALASRLHALHESSTERDTRTILAATLLCQSRAWGVVDPRYPASGPGSRADIEERARQQRIDDPFGPPDEPESLRALTLDEAEGILTEYEGRKHHE